MLGGVDDEQQSKYEVAKQVVVSVAAGLAGYLGPGAGALAAGAAPIVQVGLNYVSSTIRSRRLDHATETLTDAADAFGAGTTAEFVEFVKAAVSDEDRQELLARALTIAQDTAMRDKRRALGRVLAQAASDTGTKVDKQLIYLRALDDLDEPHIRLLRLMAFRPSNPQSSYVASLKESREPFWQWNLHDIAQADPGIEGVARYLLPVLVRQSLISQSSEPDQRYRITGHGQFVLAMLAESE
jgi:hypothetical protein